MKGVRLLWHCDYWDGPISGVAEYQGKRFWFSQVNRDKPPDSRRLYVLVRLTPAQLADEEYWHALFRAHVGTHTDYDERGKRPGEVKPRDGMQNFYEPFMKRIRPDYSTNEVVGRFRR